MSGLVNDMYFASGVDTYLKKVEGESTYGFTDREIKQKEKQNKIYIGVSIGAAIILTLIIVKVYKVRKMGGMRAVTSKDIKRLKN